MTAELYMMSLIETSVSQMKKVEAEVRRDRFPEVDLALKRLGVSGLTIAEEQRAGRGMWSYPLENIPHLILTVVVEDESAKRVVESIRESASTRSWGDGRIVVTPLDGVYDIGSRSPDHSGLMTPSMGI